MSHNPGTGLVSITFRQLSPQQIVPLVAAAGLDAIEWGGDVHVPHGDTAAARAVRQLTAAAGLQVAAYGSYYRLGHADTGPFELVLETALELAAPAIRVWAGRRASADADASYRAAVAAESVRCAELATAVGVPIVYEYHRDSLTDTASSACQLLEAVDHPNVRTYWQPPRHSVAADNVRDLARLLPWLHGLHVFSWHADSGEREPLTAGAEPWQRYLQAAGERAQYALLEFVVDDAPAQFTADAATLRTWLGR